MSTVLTVGGVEFSHPIMIGAGACKTPKETRRWLSAAPVVSGSYTPEARAGNAGTCWFPDDFDGLMTHGYGLNTFGMPNPGFAAAYVGLEVVDDDAELMVSVAGFSIEDYVNGVEAFSALPQVRAIELNFGCPNVSGERIASFDITFLRLVLEALGNPTKPIWVKLSPYSDPYMLEQVAHLMCKYRDVVKAVVTCNTFPNAYDPESGISANQGFAGLSGPAMKSIALGQVRQFNMYCCYHNIDVIGVGGITTGDDVVDFLEAGASAVQLVSMPFSLGTPGLLWDYLMGGDRFKAYLDTLDPEME